MEFVVIVLFVAAIVLVNFLVVRAQRRRAERPPVTDPAENAAQGGKPAGRAPAGTSLDAAREAVSRLDEAGHRQVYAAIAQGQPIRAIQVYAQATGCGLRAASSAVASLASHPVPYIPKTPKAGPVAPAEPETAGTDAARTDAAGTDAAAAGPAVQDAGKDAAPEAAAPRDTGKNTTPKDAGKESSPSGTSGKDTGKGNAQTLPDEAEISKWAQNLRPEDF